MDTGMRDGAMPHVRRRVALALTVVLGAAFLMPATSSFGATGTVSVVDYSQCANGTGTDLDCHVQGWINGIMQKSNSHFKEGDVTPQRLIVTVVKDRPGGVDHEIKLRYQARKGTTHAYDSLSTWNNTVSGANRCLGLTPAIQTALNCSGSPTPSTFAVTEDTTEVDPVFPTSVDKHTNEHDLPGNLVMFGGVITGMTAPHHDNPTCSSKCADDYATTTITFTAAAGTTVELLFGGHLGVSPLNRGGWGNGLGASNINGGPYHIKWDAADGGSVGNRDNQITGGDIQALAEPGIGSLASPNTATIGTAVALSDTITLSGATDPSGAVSLALWGPYDAGAGTCGTDSTVTESAVAVGSITFGAWLKTGGGTGLGTWTRTGTTAANYTFPADSDGTYYWVASVAADNNNTSAGPAGCNDSDEAVTVTKATPTGGTTVVIDDNATVTGDGTNVPGGTVTFLLYDNDSSCGVTDPAVLPVFDSGAVAVTADGTNAVASASAAYETTPSHTYYWKVTYSGDGIYNGATLSDCVESAAIT